jgi:hypothetical protein
MGARAMAEVGGERCAYDRGWARHGAVVIVLTVVVEGDIASVLEHTAVVGIARIGARL